MELRLSAARSSCPRAAQPQHQGGKSGPTVPYLRSRPRTKAPNAAAALSIHPLQPSPPRALYTATKMQLSARRVAGALPHSLVDDDACWGWVGGRKAVPAPSTSRRPSAKPPKWSRWWRWHLVTMPVTSALLVRISGRWWTTRCGYAARRDTAAAKGLRSLRASALTDPALSTAVSSAQPITHHHPSQVPQSGQRA